MQVELHLEILRQSKVPHLMAPHINCASLLNPLVPLAAADAAEAASLLCMCLPWDWGRLGIHYCCLCMTEDFPRRLLSLQKSRQRRNI